jgi:hypothetical protein
MLREGDVIKRNIFSQTGITGLTLTITTNRKKIKSIRSENIHTTILE